MRNTDVLRPETLEARRLLAISAVVDDGDLVITGDSEGDVEIVAVAVGQYQVSEAGVVVFDSTQLQGVTDDIRIDLEETVDDANDNVLVDLAGETVDRVYASLGDGDNSFVISSGTVSSVVYRGGDGVDDLELYATVESFAWILLGDGDNSLAVSSEVERLYVWGGSGADSVELTEEAELGSASLRLGAGDNDTTVAGNVERRLKIAGGEDDDTVDIMEAASVEGRASLRLGDGANSATVDGVVGKSVGYKGGVGDDSLTVSDSANVGNNVTAKLGEGENTVNVQATVGGDVNVMSNNADDDSRITVDEDSVEGEVNLEPGKQPAGYYFFAPGEGRSFRRFRFGRR